MMTEYNIRSGIKGDWVTLGESDRELFPDEPMTEEWYIDKMESPVTQVFVADSNGTALGYLVVTVDGLSCVINRVGVRIEHQNKGIGTNLMKTALKWLQEQKIHHVKLYVLMDNPQALALYKKSGFHTGGRAWHYIVPFDRVEDANPKFKCEILSPSIIQEVSIKFHQLEEMIRRFYEDPKNVSLVLKSDKLIGYCRFTPSFPGAFPFIITDLRGFDSFGQCLISFSQNNFDYFRLTFEDNEELANFLEKRGCQLHHNMYYLTLDL